MGDVAIARLALETLPYMGSSIDRSQFQTDVDHASSVYTQAVTVLYQPETTPEVYSLAYHPKNHSSSSRYNGEKIKIQETQTINIAPVIKQLNQDFVLCDCTDEEIYTPLSYTGRHKGPNRNQIELTATFEQNPEPGFFPIIIPSFWMDVLSHFLTLILSSVLIGAGATVIASGLGAILGTCMIVAGARGIMVLSWVYSLVHKKEQRLFHLHLLNRMT